MNHLQVTFVIGANATGKSHFIRTRFSDKDVECLNVYDYQGRAYKEAGIGGRFLNSENRKCLYNANLLLLKDIIALLQEGRSVVVEHTLFKAKRRISYIDAIRKAVDAEIEFFVMCPSDKQWEAFIAERKLQGDFQYYKRMAEDIEFPNPAGKLRIKPFLTAGCHIFSGFAPVGYYPFYPLKQANMTVII